jgi:hypothetical protein
MRVFGFFTFLAVVALVGCGLFFLVGDIDGRESTTYIYLPSEVALSDGQYGQTGQGQTQTFTVSLAAGEAVIGQSYGFNHQETGCRVWIVAGPFAGPITVDDGEWFVFVGMRLSSSQQANLLRQAANKQAAQGYGCTASNQRVDWLGGVQ